MAIQQRHEPWKSFSRFTNAENEWLMAKVCVTNADSQYHEVSSLQRRIYSRCSNSHPFTQWVSHLCATLI